MNIKCAARKIMSLSNRLASKQLYQASGMNDATPLSLLKLIILDEFARLSRGEQHILSWQSLSILIEFETLRFERNGQNFDCILVKIGNLKNLIEDAKLRVANDDVRFTSQIIVQFEQNQIPHYVTLDVYIDKSVSYCFVLDASNCAETFPGLLTKVRALFQHVYAVIGSENTAILKLQNDTHSCPLFAFDHAIEMSQIKNNFAWLRKHAIFIDSFHELEKFAKNENIDIKYLKKIFDMHPPQKILDMSNQDEAKVKIKPNQSIIFWGQLPFKLIKNIQSLSSVDIYLKLHEKSHLKGNAVRLAEHVAVYEKPMLHKGQQKRKNGSLDNKMAEYYHALTMFLSVIDNETLANFLFNEKAKIVNHFLQIIQSKWSNFPSSQFFKIREYAFNGSEKLLKRFARNIGKLKPAAVNLVQNEFCNIGDVLTDERFNEKLAVLIIPDLIHQGVISSTVFLNMKLSQAQRLNDPQIMLHLKKEESVEKKREFIQCILTANGDFNASDCCVTFFSSTKTTSLSIIKNITNNVITAEDDEESLNCLFH